MIATRRVMRRTVERRGQRIGCRPTVEGLEVRQLLSFDLSLPEIQVDPQTISSAETLLLQFQSGVSTPEAVAAELVETWDWVTSVESIGLGTWEVGLDSGIGLDKAASLLMTDDRVAVAEPDFQIQVAGIEPNDQYFDLLYGFENMGVPTAWESGTSASSIVVAVIDTGIDLDHPDLQANIWTNPGEVPNNGIDDDNNGFIDDVNGWDFHSNDNNPDDGNGHGTHVAGTIGAVGNNGIGVAGVAWDVQLMPLKFLSDSGSGSTSNAITAVNYAVQNGAQISNNSWGGGGFSTILYNAIANAGDQGHIFVAAAGNSGQNADLNPSYPAAYNLDNIVSVAAVDSNDNLASFSNYGAFSVDIAAPGVQIASTYADGRYAYLSGTSMAAPQVSGVLALYWAQNPELSYSEVIDDLYATVEPIAGLAGAVKTGGRVDAEALIALGGGGGSEDPGDQTAPTLIAAEADGSSFGTFDQITLTFDEAIAPTSLSSELFTLTGPSGEDVPVTIAGLTSGATQVVLQFEPVDQSGSYVLNVAPGISDQSGNPIVTPYSALFELETALVFKSTDSAKLIWDFSTTTMDIEVPDDFEIGSIQVAVNLTHTYVGDLVVKIVTPDGHNRSLIRNFGGSGNHMLDTVFDVNAETSIYEGEAPFTGTWVPHHQRWNQVIGSNAQGTWQLQVKDRARLDFGFLLDWQLIITPALSNGTNGGFGLIETLPPIETGLTSGPLAPGVEPDAPIVGAPTLPPPSRSISEPADGAIVPASGSFESFAMMLALFGNADVIDDMLGEDEGDSLIG